MIKFFILNIILTLGFEVRAAKVTKSTSLKTPLCNEVLEETSGEKSAIISKQVQRFIELSTTEIRFSPWNPSYLLQLPGFSLQSHPDSDSQILQIGGAESYSSRDQAFEDSIRGYISNQDPYLLGNNSNSLRVSGSNLGSMRTQLPSTHLNYSENQSGSTDLQRLTLQRLGDERYFQFRPYNSSELVAARILDIQETRGELKVLAEWVDLRNNKTLVGLLTTEELRSIERPHDTQKFALDVKELFESFIDPEALYIKDGFKSEGLPTLFNEGLRPNRIEPFDTNVYFHFTASSLKFFPNASTGIEAYFKMANQSPSTEMMLNLDPNYIYNWIINENGELQISVHVERQKDSDHVPRPTLYLLSKGRGILMGGYLKNDGNSWQAVIDTDGGFYGVLSTQDVEIDLSDDVLGLSTGARVYFHSSHTKVPIIPYLNHLEEYVYWIQEAFLTSTGLMPEVGKYWENVGLWYQSDFSTSRGMDRPTTEEEAKRFTILEKFFSRQNEKSGEASKNKRQAHQNKSDRTRSTGSRRAGGESGNSEKASRTNWTDQNNFNNSNLRLPWQDPMDLISFYADDLNAKINDLSNALWALGVDVRDGSVNLSDEKSVKKFYQKLLSQYHPDLLIKKRAGQEQIKVGQAVTAIITQAWKTYKNELKKGKFK